MRKRSWPGLTRDNLNFVVLMFAFAIVTHAMAYLTHEYAHTVTAWTLGWMLHPFGIDYGPPTVSNVIFLDDVSDNVSYDPIFASGHGWSAAAIALAGPFLGNGLFYFAIYAIASLGFFASRRYVSLFLYWLSLMCAANVWSYVPIRAITTHADIALAAKGMGLSPWALFPFVMALSGFITWHFFHRMFASAYPRIVQSSITDGVVFIAFTGFWYFSFFGGSGIDGSYGLVSQVLAILSRYLLFPLCVMYLGSMRLKEGAVG